MKVMNDEMKKIISHFLFVSVIISCLTLLSAGTLTAKQRSEYNSYRTEYALLTFKTSDRKIDLSLDDKKYTFDFSRFRLDEEQVEWLYLTPASVFLFLGECIFDIFSP